MAIAPNNMQMRLGPVQMTPALGGIPLVGITSVGHALVALGDGADRLPLEAERRFDGFYQLTLPSGTSYPFESEATRAHIYGVVLPSLLRCLAGGEKRRIFYFPENDGVGVYDDTLRRHVAPEGHPAKRAIDLFHRVELGVYRFAADRYNLDMEEPEMTRFAGAFGDLQRGVYGYTIDIPLLPPTVEGKGRAAVELTTLNAVFRDSFNDFERGENTREIGWKGDAFIGNMGIKTSIFPHSSMNRGWDWSGDYFVSPPDESFSLRIAINRRATGDALDETYDPQEKILLRAAAEEVAARLRIGLAPWFVAV